MSDGGRVDVVELERVARKAYEARLLLEQSPTHAHNGWLSGEASWDYQKLAKPEVVLALIARIHEIRKALDEALVYWLSLNPADIGRVGQLREVLEKGAELP